MSRAEVELTKLTSFKTTVYVFHYTNLLIKNFSIFNFILMLEQTQLPSCHVTSYPFIVFR